MDTYHPDMQRALAEHYQNQRQQRDQASAHAASVVAQAAAKAANHQYDMQQAARLAGA